MNVDLPAEIACLTRTAPLPQMYEEAKKAIAECARLDECAGWADKAAASPLTRGRPMTSNSKPGPAESGIVPLAVVANFCVPSMPAAATAAKT